RHEGHAGGTESRGTAPQGRRPTGPPGTGQAPRPGAGAVKGTAFCRPLLGASRFTTPFCTELSTFTHGRRLPYETDYFTRYCPPEYPPAPCPLAAGTGRRAHRHGAGGPCLPGLRQLRRVWEVPA